MAKTPEIDVEDMVIPETVVTPTIEKVVMKSKPIAKSTTPAFSGEDLNPSNWDIKREDAAIIAVNQVTGNTFNGDPKEFSSLLKG